MIRKIKLEYFREKLKEYAGQMDSAFFINAFVDLSHEHKDNLELILEGMEKAKMNYQKKVKYF